MEASLLDAAFSQESHRATEAWRGLGGYIHHNHPPAGSAWRVPPSGCAKSMEVACTVRLGHSWPRGYVSGWSEGGEGRMEEEEGPKG